MSGETEKQVSGWTVDTLKESVDRRLDVIIKIMDERDRLYKERADAQLKALEAALAASKEQTKQSFEASEKAIVKAEKAQSDYNVRSNEFRGQLDDQAKRLITRTEVETMLKSIEDKIARLDNDLREVREKYSAGGGADAGGRRVKDESRANLGVLISIGGSIMTFVGLLIVFWKMSAGQ